MEYTMTKEIRLDAFINTAKNIANGKGLGLTADNFIVLVENIQLKYGYTKEEIEHIWAALKLPQSN